MVAVIKTYHDTFIQSKDNTNRLQILLYLHIFIYLHKLYEYI